MGGVQPHLFHPCRTEPKASTHHGRCNTPQRASHCGKPVKKGVVLRRIGRTKGGLKSKLYGAIRTESRYACFSEGQMSDYKEAALQLPVQPDTQKLSADRSYDTNCFRQVQFDRNIKACIPLSKGQNNWNPL